MHIIKLLSNNNDVTHKIKLILQVLYVCILLAGLEVRELTHTYEYGA